jgi:hypothetical protein
MKQLGVLVFLIALMLAANLIAQRLMPTLRRDGMIQRIGYHYLVALVAGVMLAVIIAAVVVADYWH